MVLQIKNLLELPTVFNSYRSSAKKKNLQFSLTKEQIKNLIEQNCHYCNKIPSDNYVSRKDLSESGTFYRNGIDRKDNSEGYILENCVTCCKKCNYLKKDLNYEEFVLLINSITDNLRNKNETKKL